MSDLLSAIEYLDHDDYDTWIKVGMALKHEGYSISDWDAWSSKSGKYHPGVCEKKWNSFNESNSGDPVTGGTIIQMARDAGYSDLDWETFGWDDEVEEVGLDYKVVKPDFVGEERIPAIPKNYDGAAELREYLSELFNPEEYVGYCDKLTFNAERDVWEPKNGICRRTAGELIAALKKGFNNASIRAESKAGALIRFNPLDGKGESDINVTDFRYALIESDKDSLEKQFALYKAMRLPIKFVINSGNKSLHAIVHIDAENAQQYRQRVNFLYEFVKKNGLTPDEQDKNASRYSRMPGILRNDKQQYICARDIGKSDYKSWKEWADAQNDNLPKDVSLADAFANMPPLKEELIPGILRVGHKLLLSGPSKAGKSFLLNDLAICFAEGREWIGHKCKQGKVLYINLELDDASCIHRFDDIYKRKNIPKENLQNITIWNLRGRSVPMDKLTPFMINRYKGKGYIAIIIDPIYKVITGDENSATDMSLFCSYFDRVAIEIGAAVIYCHHHSKGASGKYANAADRASGSGVFARDPDAILDLTQLQLSPDAEDRYRKQVPEASQGLTAWELSATLREFPAPDPVRMWFDWPIHVLDEWNFLAEAKYSASGSRGVGQGQTSKEDASQIMEETFNAMTIEANDAVEFETFACEAGLSPGQVKRYSTRSTGFQRGTLEDGTQIIFRRGQKLLMYRGTAYKPPKNLSGKNARWEPV